MYLLIVFKTSLSRPDIFNLNNLGTSSKYSSNTKSSTFDELTFLISKPEIVSNFTNFINIYNKYNPNDTNIISFKEVKLLCEKSEIEFKNQTFTQLMKQLRKKYYDELHGRIKFIPEFKKLVLNKAIIMCLL